MVKDVKAEMPIEGQQLSFLDLQNEIDAQSLKMFQEALSEETALRQHVGRFIF